MDTNTHLKFKADMKDSGFSITKKAALVASMVALWTIGLFIFGAPILFVVYAIGDPSVVQGDRIGAAVTQVIFSLILIFSAISIRRYLKTSAEENRGAASSAEPPANLPQ